MRPAVRIAALGVLLVLVAGVFDAEPLYVAGIAFAVLAGASAAWVALAARRVRVERVLGARRVVEDEPLDVRIRVRTGRIPLPAGVVRDPLLAGAGDQAGPAGGAPLPGGRGGGRLRIAARFHRRGRRRLEPPEVVVRDPLGLAARAVRGARSDEVLVLPRVEPVRMLRPDGGDRRARRRGRPAMSAEAELDGVREHRPGTPASRIYWPALARGAGLMERRLRSEADPTPLVVLDARGTSDDDGLDDLDAAVRATASLAVALARERGVAVLLPGDRRPTLLDATLAGWAHLHARLAVLAPGGRAGLANLASRAGPVLYVAARVPARTPRALAHAPAAACTLVVPGTLPGRRPVFAVAGCHGYELEPSRAGRRAAA